MAKNNTAISSSSCSSNTHHCNGDLEWLHRITSRLEKPIRIDTRKIRPCVFKVPSNISDQKPEAYTPRKIGLGPYHHFRKDLYYRMEQGKLEAVTKLLSPINQILNSQHPLILKLTHYDVVIRAFYEDGSFDLKAEVLAWLLVIDAFFLLDHLKKNHLKNKADNKMREWARDIIMMENQIPLILLRTVQNSLRPSYDWDQEFEKTFQVGIPIPPSYDLDQEFEEAVQGEIPVRPSSDLDQEFQELVQVEIPVRQSDQEFEEAVAVQGETLVRPSFVLVQEFENAAKVGIPMEVTEERSLYEMSLTFCDQHCPFNLAKLNPTRWYSDSRHLLDFMYNLIVCDDEPEPEPVYLRLLMVEEGVDFKEVMDVAGDAALFLGSLSVPWLLPIEMVLKLITSIPWDSILGLFRKVNKSDGNKGKEAKKIKIPSVSELCKGDRVKFELTRWYIGGKVQNGCIKDICFDEKDLIFRLPLITLNSIDSEVVLRNLVVHEELLDEHQRPIRIADYVDLMSGIIHTAKDVKLLREKKIIVIDGSLGDDDKLIVELFDGISKSIGSIDRESYLKSTIDAVNKHYDNRPMIKARRYMKKCFYKSWKWVTSVISVVAVLLLIWKAVCGVYDCSKFFHFEQVVSSAISLSI